MNSLHSIHLKSIVFDNVFTCFYVVAKSNSLRRIRRYLICKISTLSVSDFMKPVKSNPSQAAEQWYDMAIVTHNQIFMKCYIFKSHHLMLEESGFTCKRWFPLSHQVTAQQHKTRASTKHSFNNDTDFCSKTFWQYIFHNSLLAKSLLSPATAMSSSKELSKSPLKTLLKTP